MSVLSLVGKYEFDDFFVGIEGFFDDDDGAAANGHETFVGNFFNAARGGNAVFWRHRKIFQQVILGSELRRMNLCFEFVVGIDEVGAL